MPTSQASQQQQSSAFQKDRSTLLSSPWNANDADKQSASSRFSMSQNRGDATCKSPTPITATQLYQEEIDDEEMHQVVGGNAVDYNTNDSKYMYDDFSENDYIATGDIISKQINYNNNYTTTTVTAASTQNYALNSSLDSNSILNNQTSTGNNMIGKQSGPMSLPAVPVSQQTLTNNKSSLYCDSFATNNAYNLAKNQQDQLVDDEKNRIDDDKLGTDNLHSMSSSMYGAYMNGGTDFLNEHMYGDPMEAADNNIVLKHQQEIDPNEVYAEDYEEDLIQNQGITDFNNSYNQQYQTPYNQQYHYQEDYFNEEDEYKYLEKEREEAAGMEPRQNQQQSSVITDFSHNFLFSFSHSTKLMNCFVCCFPVAFDTVSHAVAAGR